MTERLCKEWDGMSQTMERLRSEHNTAHAEHDAAQLQIGSLQSELERQRNQKLEAESVSTRLAVELAWDRAKAQGLEKELAEVKGSLQRESEDHDNMCITISLVYNDLGVTPAQETSSLGVRAFRIMDRTRELEREALCAEVNRSFVITHSHYGESIDPEAMSLSYAPSYEDKELVGLETVVAPLSQGLSSRIEDIVLPHRG
jgi:hypothetical protein